MNINLGDGQSRRDSFRVFGSLLYQDSIFTYTHSQTISTVAIYVFTMTVSPAPFLAANFAQDFCILYLTFHQQPEEFRC